MNLFEWKAGKTAKAREDLKASIREGVLVESHSLFSDEEIQEVRDEILIEDFNEIVEDFKEVSLDDEVKLSEEVQEYHEFIPSQTGSVMNIEVEMDQEVYEANEGNLPAIAEMFFAEGYEVELQESGMAKIVFKRSKGEVFKKKKCAKGMRLVGNRCLPQTGEQKSKERRRGIKLKRAFKAMGAGRKKKAQIKKKITKRRIRGRARNLANTAN